MWERRQLLIKTISSFLNIHLTCIFWTLSIRVWLYHWLLASEGSQGVTHIVLLPHGHAQQDNITWETVGNADFSVLFQSYWNQMSRTGAWKSAHLLSIFFQSMSWFAKQSAPIKTSCILLSQYEWVVSCHTQEICLSTKNTILCDTGMRDISVYFDVTEIYMQNLVLP